MNITLTTHAIIRLRQRFCIRKSMIDDFLLLVNQSKRIGQKRGMQVRHIQYNGLEILAFIDTASWCVVTVKPTKKTEVMLELRGIQYGDKK